MKEFIYLDHNATTPIDERVLSEMMPYLTHQFGNASSRSHALGWAADGAVKIARQRVAQLLEVATKEIVFTSGATESINLAIRGVFETYKNKGNHIITAPTEHKAVLDVLDYLSVQGADIQYLSVDSQGEINLRELEDAIRDDTILVALMWANNETGVIHPMEAIADLCAERQVLLFSDATQAFGKIPVKPRHLRIPLMAFSGHKIYGPKGVGGLYISAASPRVVLAPQMIGGGQERNLRSGTLNVPGIIGLGMAAEVAEGIMTEESHRMREMRDLLASLLLPIEGATVHADRTDRLDHVLNIRFLHVESQKLMLALRDSIAIASGSACTSAVSTPSHVLQAMGLKESEAASSIRISLGRLNQLDQMTKVAKEISEAIHQIRSASPLWRLYKEGFDKIF